MGRRRIRTNAEREAERRDMLRQVARALLEAEPAEVNRVITRHVTARGDQLPRIPVIGMEPGAIRGTSPHRARIDTRSDSRTRSKS